jgi:hypothetical protein
MLMLQKSAKLWLEIWNRSGRGIPVASLPLADLCEAAGLEVGNDFDETLGELEKVGAVLSLDGKELGDLEAGRSVPGNLLAFTAKHHATFFRYAGRARRAGRPLEAVEGTGKHSRHVRG